MQLVLRPDANFRGFAGQVARGTLRAGDRVMALPSRRETTVRRIVTYDGDLAAASYPQSVTVELEDEIDLSRGEMLVAQCSADALPDVSNRFRAMVVWMHEEPLACGPDLLRQAHDAHSSCYGARDPLSRGCQHRSTTCRRMRLR